MRQKVLIIKTGYSETFVDEVSDSASLGDVLRTTALLHLYKGHEVTWLTAADCTGLLVQNPAIHKVLSFNLINVLQLLSEHFDVVINLEKAPGLCALGERVYGWQRFGFRFDPRAGKAEAYIQATEALYIATNEERKRSNTKHWLELLYNMVGEKWRGESYMLGYKPLMPIMYDVGLNYKVGRKFEGKAWDINKWVKLEKMLSDAGLCVAWQEGEDSLFHYADWIQRCRLLVTTDSLGLHIGIALKKWVVGLFGPTPAKEIQPYEKGVMIQKQMIDDITVKEVLAVCEEIGIKRS